MCLENSLTDSLREGKQVKNQLTNPVSFFFILHTVLDLVEQSMLELN